MAKEKTATTATPETATETTETGTEKLSFAKAKNLILEFVKSLGEVGNFADENGEPHGGAYVALEAFAPLDALREYAEKIKALTQRGLSLDLRIAALEKELADLYASVALDEKGKPVFTPEWQANVQKVSVKLAGLQAQEKREAKKKTEETTETTENN